MGINAQGFSARLLMGVESSFATLPGTPKAGRLPVITPAIKLNVNRFRSEALTGVAEPRPVVDGKQGNDGNFELECSKDSLALPLYGLMGAVTSVGLTGNYEHYMTFADQPTFYLEQWHTDITQYLLWLGNKVGKTALNFNFEGLMRASFDIMGASQAISSSATTSGGNIRDDSGADALSYVVGTVKYKGSTIGYLQSISVEVDRQIEAVSAMDGTTSRIDIISKLPMVKGSITALFRDASFITDSIASTEVSFEILNPSGSSGHGIRVVIPTAKLMPTSPTLAGQGLVTVQTTFDAYARGSASNIAGRVQSKGFTTVTIGAGTTDSLKIKVDGGAAQTVTLTSGSRTPAQIVANITGLPLVGATAFVENNKVVIESATKGSTSSIQIDATGTAQTPLGYVTTLQSGFDAKSLLFNLSNANSTILPP